MALLAAAGTSRLGVWQLSRAHQKLAVAAAAEQRGALPALDGASLAADDAGAQAQWRRRAVVQGRWVPGHTVWLANRTMDGRAGFFAMTPLRLARGDAVLVQRGWVARDNTDPLKLPALATPAGEVAVVGRVAPWPSHWVEVGVMAPGPIRQNVERAALSAEAGVALRPAIVVEDAVPDNASDGLARRWTPPTAGVQTNYGYAVQWFAMSVAILALAAWLLFIRRTPPAPPLSSPSRRDDDPTRP